MCYFSNTNWSNASILNRFVKRPLKDWSSATTKFKEYHEKSEIHKTAMQHFHKVNSNEAKPTDEMYDQKVSSYIKLNKYKDP